MATPSYLRRINQRAIILALLRLGSATRAHLAKVTAMSQPTVGKIVDSLLESGVLMDCEGADPTGASADAPAILGRPGQFVSLDRKHQRLLVVHLGVTHTRVAALPVGLQETDQWAVEFRTPKTPQLWADAFKAECAKLAMDDVKVVLMSTPGVVNERETRVLLSPNVRWAEWVDFAQLMRPIHQAPLLLVQEIRALALGQMMIDPKGEDFLLVDFGDGVGAAAVLHGRLFDGSLPLSGEVGHTPVVGNDRPCGCGAKGCLETLVSRRGLLALAAESRSAPRTWAALADDISAHGLRQPLIDALDAAAVVISGAINVLGLRRVLITGILSELPPAVMTHLSSAIERGAMWCRFGKVSCESAPRHRMAGLVSAAIDRYVAPVDEEQ